MYSQYARLPASYARRYANDLRSTLALDISDEVAKKLYDERLRFFEIFDVCLDLSTYLLVLSLKSTTNIDKRAHLHVNDDLVGYGRDAMYEMLVIRLRDLFNAAKDKPDEFKFNGFHQTCFELGKDYPRPNREVNNAIARIIKRRNFYSAKHSNDKKESTLKKNHLYALDLVTAVAYMAKVEENLFGTNVYNSFERLLNDEMRADRPLVLCSVYEVVTGQGYETLEYEEILETLPNGDQVVDGDYKDTPGFAAYQLKAKKEIRKIREKVEKIIG